MLYYQYAAGLQRGPARRLSIDGPASPVHIVDLVTWTLWGMGMFEMCRMWFSGSAIVRRGLRQCDEIQFADVSEVTALSAHTAVYLY